MKKTWKILLSVGGLAAGLGLAGCSTVYTRTQPYLGVGNYAPTDPAHVQILAAEPKQAKEKLGEVFLSVDGNPSRATLETKLKRAAAKLGADAVFVVSDQMHIFPVVYVDWWGSNVSQEARRGIVAIAVKYK
jgi:hypothetical protein